MRMENKPEFDNLNNWETAFSDRRLIYEMKTNIRKLQSFSQFKKEVNEFLQK